MDDISIARGLHYERWKWQNAGGLPTPNARCLYRRGSHPVIKTTTYKSFFLKKVNLGEKISVIDGFAGYLCLLSEVIKVLLYQSVFKDYARLNYTRQFLSI